MGRARDRRRVEEWHARQERRRLVVEHRERMMFLCRVNRRSIAMRYGDLRDLRRMAHRDCNSVRGFDVLVAAALREAEGQAILGTSDEQEAADKLFTWLVNEPWQWWFNRSAATLREGARRAQLTRIKNLKRKRKSCRAA